MGAMAQEIAQKSMICVWGEAVVSKVGLLRFLHYSKNMVPSWLTRLHGDWPLYKKYIAFLINQAA